MKENIMCNVYNEKDTNEMIDATLEHITKVLKNTLGPYGTNSILTNKLAGPTLCKDGYTVLGKISYNNEFSTTILNLIKAISKTLVKEVGDGSTSSIIVASALYKEILNIKNEFKIAPKEIIDTLTYLAELLETDILKKATPITDENFKVLKSIAAISNNNDDAAGDIIYELYKKVGVEGFISLEINEKATEDRVDIQNGIEFKGGYLAREFATEKNRITAVYEDAMVLLCNDTIDGADMESIGNLYAQVCTGMGKPLIIIAKNYDHEMYNFFKINRTQPSGKNFICLPLMFPLPSMEWEDRFEDMAIYLGAKIYSKVAGMSPKDITKDILGSCDRITADDTKTVIVKENLPLEVDNRICELEEYLDEFDGDLSNSKVYDLKKRIAILKAKTAVLYVGGQSYTEKETRKFLMEDAVYACKSTIENGYICGGNLIIPSCIHKKYKTYKRLLNKNKKICKSLKGEERERFIETLLDSVTTSFKQSYYTVLNNKIQDSEEINEILEKCVNNNKIFNLIEHRFEDMRKTRIINSAMTDIQIMKACFSMISLLATSNQFIGEVQALKITYN